jgi:hypothetical protein
VQARRTIVLPAILAAFVAWMATRSDNPKRAPETPKPAAAGPSLMAPTSGPEAPTLEQSTDPVRDTARRFGYVPLQLKLRGDTRRLERYGATFQQGILTHFDS